MNSQRSTVRHALPAVLLLAASCRLGADDSQEKSRAQLLAQMQALAQATKPSFLQDVDRELVFVDKPVFRYDDQPRRLLDATLWIWTRQGRPIAFQKIEAMEDNGGGPLWQYCFSSLAEERLKVEWSGREYQTAEAGVSYSPTPNAPAVAPRTPDRRRQLRELARSFSARIAPNPQSNETQEMRLLTTPIFEYEDESRLLQGAVFGYSTNGTNPDLQIVFEARPHQGKTVWHFAPARMTIGGITVKHQDKTVWECAFVEPGRNEFATWTYFQTSRKAVKVEP